MRKLYTFLGLAFLFMFAHTAKAAIVGVVPTEQVANIMVGATSQLSYDLYSLNGSALTNLATKINQTNGSQVWKIDTTIYFNDTDGLYSQAIGSTTAKKIKSQKSLEGQLFLGKNWLISNKSGKSFFFNVQTKKITNFTPTVKIIAMASATSDKSTLVMIAKNGQGKQKLFLSTTSTNKVREFPLPTKAKSCDGLAIAPKGKTVIVGCTYTVSGKSKDGYAIYTRTGNDLKLVTNTIKDDSLGQAIWQDDQTAITVASMSSGAIEVHKWKITKGKITANTKLLSNGTTESAGQTISYAPLQLQRWTSNKFYYNILYVTAADTNTFLTFIGAYNLSTGLTEVIADNSNFQLIL